MTLSSHIEAILFFKAEPVSVKELSTLLDSPEKDIHKALESLEEALTDRGVSLIQTNDTVTLTTSNEVGATIEALLKHDLEKSLGKAGLETLSIILYRGPVARSEIDYIRGVNSQYIVRQLLMRGLIEREVHPTDRRTHVYRPAVALLQYLGLSRLDELPEYARVRDDINGFVKTKDTEEPPI